MVYNTKGCRIILTVVIVVVVLVYKKYYIEVGKKVKDQNRHCVRYEGRKIYYLIFKAKSKADFTQNKINLA